MEEKRLSRRNLLVVVLLVVVIAVIGVIAALRSPTIDPTAGQLTADATRAPEATAAAEATDATEATETPAATEATVASGSPAETEPTSAAEAPAATNAPADAYLVVTVAGAMYEPIPLYEPGRYTVTRGECVNVIEVTEDSVWMAESSCDNQDCVEQGVVSLGNKASRVLQNMVICLPNEVVLELYTRDELVSYLLGMIEEAGAVE